MIIDELVLHNVGAYQGRNALTLSSQDAARPVTLIGGMNGGGKTTILDALQLCFYGPKARCSKRSELNYQDFLTESIHRYAASPEAGVTLRFAKIMDGAPSFFELNRTWKRTKSGCKETFEVYRDGRLDRAMSQNWLDQVDDFFPHNIAHLFLFDGEQIERYAARDTAPQLVRSAVHNLLGIDVVDQLERDLQAYERRHRKTDQKSAKDNSLADAEAEVEKLEQQLGEVRTQRAGLQTHKIDRLNKRLNEVEAQFKAVGGTLYEARGELEERRRVAANQVAEIRHRLRELAASDLPLTLVAPLIQSALERAHHEADAQRAAQAIELLEERNRTLLEGLEAASLSKKALQQVRRLASEQLNALNESAAAPTLLDCSQSARSRMEYLTNEGLASSQASLANELAKLEPLVAELEQLDQELTSVPPEEAVASLISERDALHQELTEAADEMRAADMLIEQLERNVETAKARVQSQLRTEASRVVTEDDIARELKHSARVRSTLHAYRGELIRRHIDRIERIVLECFRTLLHKQGLVSELKINPDSFEVVLLSSNGARVRSEELSAGERQLLAVALLWGLAKASGQELPTAIDTPLGRLDSEHRTHLIDRYFPNASHQVILLSTDEEITGSYLERLRPSIGRSYHLEFDDEHSRTRIEEGYFDPATKEELNSHA